MDRAQILEQVDQNDVRYIFLEFTDILDKNLTDAFVGTSSGDEALKKTEADWAGMVRRIGRKLLVKDLANYKAAFPKIDQPKG